MKTRQLLLKTLLSTAALALLPADASARTSFGVSVDLGGVAWSVHRSHHHTVAHVAVAPAVPAHVVYSQAVVHPRPVVVAPAVVHPYRHVVVQPAPVVYSPPVVYARPVVYAPPVVYAAAPAWHCPRTSYVPRHAVRGRPVSRAPSCRPGRR